MQMHISVFTALPQILEGPFSASLLGRARERGVVDLRIHDLLAKLRHDGCGRSIQSGACRLAGRR